MIKLWNWILSYFSKRKFIDWPDRRLISIVHVADGALPFWEKNPARWLWDSTIDLTTDAGLQDFAKKMIALADKSVELSLKANAQGMIVWEIDGGRYPTSMYLGAPDLACVLNPELNYGRGGLYGNIGGVIYDFFDRFKKAGLRIGVCIRPCEFNLTTKLQEDSPNPYQTLLRKAKFAHDWFGCTLFYIDTNTYHVADWPILPADMMKNLHMALPDCLFIPEHQDDFYYQFSAPYVDGGWEPLLTPDSAIKLFPPAFSCINVSSANLDIKRDALIQSVKAGNILMYDNWFDNPELDKVIDIYKAAIVHPTV